MVKGGDEVQYLYERVLLNENARKWLNWGG
jgi:hypothetical protein